MKTNWVTGKYTSVSNIAFIEMGAKDNEWYIYKLDNEGYLIEGFPKHTDICFDTVELAQKWSEENIKLDD